MRMSHYEDTEYSKNYKTETFRHATHNIYIILLSVLVLIVGISSFFRNPKEPKIGFDGYKSIERNFYNEKGQQVDFAKKDTYATKKGNKISVYYDVDKDLPEGQSLVFRSKNTLVKVLLNQKVIYKTQDIQAPLSMFSSGTRWNFVSIPIEGRSGKLEIQIEQSYQDGRAKVDHLFLGDRAQILLSIIKDKLFALFISLVVIVVGAVYIIIDIFMNEKKTEDKKQRSLFYLGTSAIFIALWCFIETNIPQLFIKDLCVLQLIDNMILTFVCLGMYIYMDCEYNVFKKRWLRIPIISDLIYICVAIAFHVTRFLDFHQMIPGAIFQFILIVVMMSACIWYQSIYYHSSNGRIKNYYRMQKIGVAALIWGTVIDVIRYIMQDTLDRAFAIRIGVVVFVLCFGSGNIRELIVLARQGENADLMRNLAYNDSLTGVENRNSFEQRMEELTEEDIGMIGIVMCDVNNLKQINDMQGHQLGDALICAAAEIICDSFGQFGTVYRIGGDEFCVLIERNDATDCYRQAKYIFYEKLKQYNRYFSFKISIAHGVAYCVDVTKDGFARAQKEADQEMYENKRYIKIKEHRAMR